MQKPDYGKGRLQDQGRQGRWVEKQPKNLFLLLTGVLLTGLLLVSVSCSVLPGRSAGVTPAPGTVMFTDDFADPPSGWGTWSRGGAKVEYHNGGLRIQVSEAQFDFWSVAGQKFADARIEVDATKIGGPDDNDFGIVCRYQDKDNFYMLVASNDGYYGIARMLNGQYSMIGADQLQYSSAIARGSDPNHLRADCVGNTLALYANGQKLMEVEDESFSSGDVGLIAGAYNVQGVDILFDNFSVKMP